MPRSEVISELLVNEAPVVDDFAVGSLQAGDNGLAGLERAKPINVAEKGLEVVPFERGFKVLDGLLPALRRRLVEAHLDGGFPAGKVSWCLVPPVDVSTRLEAISKQIVVLGSRGRSLASGRPEWWSRHWRGP